MIWRRVRDRPGGRVHAVPADFQATVWYAVCLRRVNAATAVDITDADRRECGMCRFVVRHLAVGDQQALPEPGEPTPDEVAAEYPAGASLEALSFLSVHRAQRKLDAAGVAARTPEQTRRMVHHNGVGA